MHNFILLENRRAKKNEKSSLYFTHPTQEIICKDPSQLTYCFDVIEKLKNSGYYLAGFISYEASYFFEHNKPFWKNKAHPNNFPLLHFLAFKSCQYLNQTEVNQLLKQQTADHSDESFAFHLSLDINKTEYETNFNKIKQHLIKGNTYQVNYTTKYYFDVQGDPVQLYQTLRERQKVEYSALLQFDDYQILSLSPELFFSKRAEDLTAKPMKGTMPRSLNPQIDQENKNKLLSDPKLRSENIIIVDLLRNDLSTLSKAGSVHVSELLQVETYETVHQMTSTIHSKIDTDTSFKSLLFNLFPCGSITGAPKKSTMKIIRECEKKPRNIYTGCIGYITPTNDMCFNVAIRTLCIAQNKGELGIGGGITNDSNLDSEFEELHLKARFFTDMDVGFQLIESMKYNRHLGYVLLDEHLNRLKNSALVFNFLFDEKSIKNKLQSLTSQFKNKVDYKVRVVLSKDGTLNINFSKIYILPSKYLIKLYTKECVDSKNILLHHKTINSTIRAFYDDIMLAYSPSYYDVIFMNEKGFITESSKANLFIQLKGKILTPPLDCGLLPGTMRHQLLKENSSIEEAYLNKQDLETAEKIWLTNSVRGMTEVFL